MSNRKLLTEIERTLKKVDEGIEEFDELETKLNASTTHSQKERWESEMKKEIKRLQRLRDQIKGWQTLSEIKDKEPLNDSRRKIEVLMEKFKSLEKDLKIKAYSKEGLIAASKLDPKEKEKLDVTNWVTETVDKLRTQVDAFEAELEVSFLSIKKGSGRKGVESKSPRQLELERNVTRHKSYIDNLEIILRKIENEDILPEEIVDLREYIDYFVESNGDPDFMEDEMVFDEFDLDDVEDYTKAISMPMKDDNATSLVADKHSSSLPSAASDKGHVAGLDKNATSSSVESTPPSTKINNKPLAASKPQQPFSSTLKGRSPGSHVAHESTETAGNAHAPATPSHDASRGWTKPPVIVSSALKKSTELSSSSLDHKSGAPAAVHIVSEKELMTRIESEIKNARHASSIAALGDSSFSELEDLVLDGSTSAKFEGFSAYRTKVKSLPVGAPPPADVSLLSRLPLALHVPACFQRPSFYERLHLDTLFAIFYYLPGTFAQYLAARELKRQSWRFHKKYLTWFQRHEEPKVITEDYEQGTYIYFDYEGAWCQRKKSEFTFEYRFLEDCELV